MSHCTASAAFHVPGRCDCPSCTDLLSMSFHIKDLPCPIFPGAPSHQVTPNTVMAMYLLNPFTVASCVRCDFSIKLWLFTVHATGNQQ